MLNDVYLADWLLEFHLGARAQALAYTTRVGTSAARTSEDHDIKTNEPLVLEEPPVF